MYMSGQPQNKNQEKGHVGVKRTIHRQGEQMTEYMRTSGIEKIGRLAYESENYDELSGVDRTMSRWLGGCTLDGKCDCYRCRSGMDEYWNDVNNGQVYMDDFRTVDEVTAEIKRLNELNDKLQNDLDVKM